MFYIKTLDERVSDLKATHKVSLDKFIQKLDASDIRYKNIRNCINDRSLDFLRPIFSELFEYSPMYYDRWISRDNISPEIKKFAEHVHQSIKSHYEALEREGRIRRASESKAQSNHGQDYFRDTRPYQQILHLKDEPVDQMSGEEFERYLMKKLKGLGALEIRGTPKTGDQGGDILFQFAGQKVVIQAKRHKGRIGNGAVQEVIAAKGYYDCDLAWVVTNSVFTPKAVKLAGKLGITLIDGKKLERLDADFEKYFKGRHKVA
jgi:hypothetical protein